MFSLQQREMDYFMTCRRHWILSLLMTHKATFDMQVISSYTLQWYDTIGFCHFHPLNVMLRKKLCIAPTGNRIFQLSNLPTKNTDRLQVLCQDRFSSTILLGGPGMQGTNEEVSPDTSRCWLVRTIKSGSYGRSPGTREALGVSPDHGKVVRS